MVWWYSSILHVVGSNFLVPAVIKLPGENGHITSKSQSSAAVASISTEQILVPHHIAEHTKQLLMMMENLIDGNSSSSPSPNKSANSVCLSATSQDVIPLILHHQIIGKRMTPGRS